jgi:Xaa-Pro aminopeptidase
MGRTRVQTDGSGRPPGRLRRLGGIAVVVAAAVVTGECAHGGGGHAHQPGHPGGPGRPGAEQHMPPGTPVALTLRAIEPLEPFPPSEFAARRDSVMAHMGGGIAVIVGRPPLTSERRFLQDHDFYYLTGVETPNAALILDAQAHQAHLFLPEQSQVSAQFDGPQLTPGPDAVQQTGIQDIRKRSDFDPVLRQMAGSASAIWLLESPPEPPPTSSDDATAAWRDISADPWNGIENRHQRLMERIQQQFPGREIHDLSPVMAELRWVKSPMEQDYMRRAGFISALAMNEAIRSTNPGYYEWEVASAATFIQHELGAQEDAFAPILASGPNINTIHYDKLSRRIQAEDLVLLDYGADFHYYVSDITRTWTASGQFTADELPYYQTVQLVRDSVIAAMKPGVTLAELLQIAQRIVRARGHDSVAWPTTRNYIGHWVGMSVHDPDPPGAETRPLVPGVVFNVEPIIDVPDHHWHFRIEDTVLITKDGHEVLTSTSPVAPIDLTALYLEVGVVEWWKGQEGGVGG